MRYPSFIGPSYTSQSKIAACDRLVNWYLERVEVGGGKTDWVAYPTPGFSTLCTLSDTGSRGFFSLNGRLFAVFGSTLFEIYADWSYEVRGTGLNNLDGSPVTFCCNGDAGHQLGITAGSKFYVYDLTANTFSFVLDGATHCGFIDGFALVLDPGTSTLKPSALEDFATFDPLDEIQRNDAADRWIALAVAHKEAWLFGSETTSVYYDAGADGFVPNPSVLIGQGTGSPHSVAILDGAPIWLGQNKAGGAMVFYAQGYTPVRVSNHAVEYALSRYSTIADALAWTYQDQGHDFYVLTFPTARATWVFDRITGQWHERGMFEGSEFIGLQVHAHAYAFGKHITGSRTLGRVYEMSTALTTEAE